MDKRVYLPASSHSAKECMDAFEWLRIEATKPDASAHAGVAFDEWHATSSILRNAHFEENPYSAGSLGKQRRKRFSDHG